MTVIEVNGQPVESQITPFCWYSLDLPDLFPFLNLQEQREALRQFEDFRAHFVPPDTAIPSRYPEDELINKVAWMIYRPELRLKKTGLATSFLALLLDQSKDPLLSELRRNEEVGCHVLILASLHDLNIQFGQDPIPVGQPKDPEEIKQRETAHQTIKSLCNYLSILRERQRIVSGERLS